MVFTALAECKGSVELWSMVTGARNGKANNLHELFRLNLYGI